MRRHRVIVIYTNGQPYIIRVIKLLYLRTYASVNINVLC